MLEEFRWYSHRGSPDHWGVEAILRVVNSHLTEILMAVRIISP
jgi:hypothetical protein